MLEVAVSNKFFAGDVAGERTQLVQTHVGRSHYLRDCLVGRGVAELGDGAVLVDDVPAPLEYERVTVQQILRSGHFFGVHSEHEAGVRACPAEQQLGLVVAGLDQHFLLGVETLQVRQVQLEMTRYVFVRA